MSCVLYFYHSFSVHTRPKDEHNHTCGHDGRAVAHVDKYLSTVKSTNDKTEEKTMD